MHKLITFVVIRAKWHNSMYSRSSYYEINKWIFSFHKLIKIYKKNVCHYFDFNYFHIHYAYRLLWLSLLILIKLFLHAYHNNWVLVGIYYFNKPKHTINSISIYFMNTYNYIQIVLLIMTIYLLSIITITCKGERSYHFSKPDWLKWEWRKVSSGICQVPILF